MSFPFLVTCQHDQIGLDLPLQDLLKARSFLIHVHFFIKARFLWMKIWNILSFNNIVCIFVLKCLNLRVCLCALCLGLASACLVFDFRLCVTALHTWSSTPQDYAYMLEGLPENPFQGALVARCRIEDFVVLYTVSSLKVTKHDMGTLQVIETMSLAKNNQI